MTTKLSKPIVREMELKDADGKVGPVLVTLDESGIELRRKGSSSRKATLSWEDVGAFAELPGDAPIKYARNAIGWLVEEAKAEKPDESVPESPATSDL